METCEKLKKILQDHKTCLFVLTVILLLFLGYLFLRENFKTIYEFLVDEEHKNIELVGAVGGFVLFIGSLITYTAYPQ